MDDAFNTDTASTPRPIEESVSVIYEHRFSPEIRRRRHEVWAVLCDRWFSRYVSPKATVLEVGAGYCEFINNIKAKTKIAVDLNVDTQRFANSDVRVINEDAAKLEEHVPAGSVDVVFMSNFLEHCRSRDHMLAVLRSATRVLKPGGSILILGPNFRFAYRVYYDFFDHHLALSERAVVEALNIVGLRPVEVHARTLPFTFNGKLPTAPWLVRVYLRFPLLWRLFGMQFFVVGRSAL